MDPERWQRLQEVVDAALDLPPDARPDYLDRTCAGDVDLHQKAIELIDADAHAGNLLEVAVQHGARAALAGGAPQVVGRYRILRMLGEGGMGTVYEAEQDQPRRKVALKIVRPGLTTPALLRRFKREAEVLGRLHHPGIAEIYEAGTEETGAVPQPYFAMELIAGEDVVTYSTSRRPGSRQRLELMEKICDAVHHAHQRGVIHRDLKPGNILVDESGQPKVLDFGVARIITADEPLTRQTDVGQLIGTLNYMSPEQVLGDPNEVDTRSDVYALGVILYQLLAGRLPYDLKGKPLPEAVMAIRYDEPVSLHTVHREYRGDIGTIVARALEKDKTRRYGSAYELASDIRRYLRDEPILARPPTVSYQLAKFARRNRALVTAVAAVVVVLFAGVIVSTWQAVEARRAQREAIHERDNAASAQRAALLERDRAVNAERLAAAQRDRATAADVRSQRERDRAIAESKRADAEAATTRAVSDFLQNDLLAQASAVAQANRNSTPRRDLRVREALDRAASAIGGKFNGQPQVEGAVRHTIGYTYHDLGLYREARVQLERALELRRQTLGADHADTLTTLHSLGAAARGEGRYDDAVRIYSEAAGLRRKTLGSEHIDTLRSLHGVAISLRTLGKNAEAIRLHREILATRTRVLGETHPDTMRSMNDLSAALLYSGQRAEAVELAERTYAVRSKALGSEHPETLTSLHTLGLSHYSAGNMDRAIELFEKALEAQRRIMGAEHPETLDTMNNLGNAYNARTDFAASAKVLAEALGVSRRVLGERHARTLLVSGNLANIYLNAGDLREAESLYRSTLEGLHATVAADHADVLRNSHNAARFYMTAGRLVEAGQIARKVVEARRRILGREHPTTIGSVAILAEILSRQGNHAEAETLAIEVLDIRVRKNGRAESSALEAMESLALIRLRQGRYGEAEALSRETLKAREEARQKTGYRGWRLYLAQSLLGASLAGQRRLADAEPLLREGCQGAERARANVALPEYIQIDEPRASLARLYEERGKPELAAPWRVSLVR